MASWASLGMKSGLQPCWGCGVQDGVAGGGGVVGVVGLREAARDHGGGVGFAENDFCVGAFVGQDAGDAFEGSSGAEAGDPIVEGLAFEVAEDLLRGGAGVEVGVGLVGELAGEEPAVFGGELFGFFDHAGTACGAGGDDDSGSEEAHELAALDGEGFGHGDDEGIAFGGADHGEADAGVAAGGFDYGLAGFEGALLFGVFDDSEGEAVFDGAEGVEGFDFYVEVDAFGGEVVDADGGGVADGAQDVVVFHLGGSPSGIGSRTFVSTIQFVGDAGKMRGFFAPLRMTTS